MSLRCSWSSSSPSLPLPWLLSLSMAPSIDARTPCVLLSLDIELLLVTRPRSDVDDRFLDGGTLSDGIMVVECLTLWMLMSLSIGDDAALSFSCSFWSSLRSSSSRRFAPVILNRMFNWRFDVSHSSCPNDLQYSCWAGSLTWQRVCIA